MSASAAARPGSKYTTIINTQTIMSPIPPAYKDVDIASSPSFAPTTFDLSSFNSI